MMNVCAHCGLYRADKRVVGPTRSGSRPNPSRPGSVQTDARRAVAICPECGHMHPFRRLPLLLIGGASAAGKSAVLQELAGRFTDAVLLDADILWLEEFEKPQTGHRDFFETWLRLAKNIGQSGRQVALFGAGFVVPGHVEPCVERRYFSHTHYLTLVCEEQALRRRLHARPAWRKSSQASSLRAQLDFNRWLRVEGPRQNPPLTLLDTTNTPVAATASAVAEWMQERISIEQPQVDR